MDTILAGRQLCLPFPDIPPEREPRPRQLTNREVAELLYELSKLLREQGANPFRVRAYERAAETLRGLKQPAYEIVLEEGLSGLTRLPGVGRSLARAIDQFARTGRLALLQRLRGLNAPEKVFATVPDIGPGLAHRIHRELGIETLADLEVAARDGRLRSVPGMGPKRLRAVRESLAGRFHHGVQAAKRVEHRSSADPPVDELLDVDLQYRNSAEMGRLPRVAPRHFNPTGDAWLPVLRTSRKGRGYTVMYSNTAHAHELGTTGDWVIVTRDDNHSHDQWTVITSQYGALRGQRIVRGREDECAEFYRRKRAI
jgi:DNA polymerase (family X)